MNRFLFVLVMILGLYSFKNENDNTVYVSHYHDKFNGKRTASGEKFDNKQLTAAHRSLPFGTLVKITNPKTEKSVIVRINDRGPFTKNRVFDLSKAAFDEIGDPRQGIMLVKYEIITDENPIENLDENTSTEEIQGEN